MNTTFTRLNKFPSEVLGTQLANACLRNLYKSGVWLRSERARDIGLQGMGFLRIYSRLALRAYRDGVCRFGLVPKLHFLNHLLVDVLRQCSANRWTLSPLVYSVQLQEDFIGRPSRLSRRVSAKGNNHALRTIQRMMLAMFAEFERLKEV